MELDLIIIVDRVRIIGRPMQRPVETVEDYTYFKHAFRIEDFRSAQESRVEGIIWITCTAPGDGVDTFMAKSNLHHVCDTVALNMGKMESLRAGL